MKIWLNLLISLITVSLAAVLLFRSYSAPPDSSGPKPEKLLALAQELRSEGLHSSAVEVYRQYLDKAQLGATEAANIYYLVGTIQMDQLRQYEPAIASLLMARQLDPSGPLKSEIGRRLVTSLENLNKPGAASRRLTAETSPQEKAASAPATGVVVASIDGRPVTWEEVRSRWEQLPAGARGKMQSVEEVREAVTGFLAEELLFESAKRRGFDQDPEVQDKMRQVLRQLATSRVYQEEVASKVQPGETDLNLYYEAHKAAFKTKGEEGKPERIPPFEEVRDRVERLYRQEKEQELYQKLVQQLLTANRVEFDDDGIGKVVESNS